MISTGSLLHNQTKQSGLSLIELMIAMALGLVLTLGVVQIFLGSSQTYRLTDALGKIQENVRFSMGQLQYDGRMAGHFGCLIGEPFNQLNETSAGYEPVAYDGGAIMGWDAAGTGLGGQFEIETLEPGGGNWSNGSGDNVPDAIDNEMIPGTDFFVVNGGQVIDVQLQAGNPQNGNTLNTDGDHGLGSGAVLVVIAGDCSGADLFQKGNNPNGDALEKSAGAGGNAPGNKNTSGFNGNYDEEASLYQFKSTAYFIGEGQSGEPALFRERIDAGGPGNAEELAEGVENMQVLYGVSGGVDRRADRYVTAADVADWDQVVSLRIAMLYRSEDRMADEEEARTFNLASTEVTTQSDRRARLVALSTIGIRNRLE